MQPLTKQEFIKQAIDCRFIEDTEDDKRILSEMLDSVIQTSIAKHDIEIGYKPNKMSNKISEIHGNKIFKNK